MSQQTRLSEFRAGQRVILTPKGVGAGLQGKAPEPIGIVLQVDETKRRLTVHRLGVKDPGSYSMDYWEPLLEPAELFAQRRIKQTEGTRRQTGLSDEDLAELKNGDALANYLRVIDEALARGAERDSALAYASAAREALATLAGRLRKQAAFHHGDEHPPLEEALIVLAVWAEDSLSSTPPSVQKFAERQKALEAVAKAARFHRGAMDVPDGTADTERSWVTFKDAIDRLDAIGRTGGEA